MLDFMEYMATRADLEDQMRQSKLAESAEVNALVLKSNSEKGALRSALDKMKSETHQRIQQIEWSTGTEIRTLRERHKQNRKSIFMEIHKLEAEWKSQNMEEKEVVV